MPGLRGSETGFDWVGVAGFETAASSSRTKRRLAKLRYNPGPAAEPQTRLPREDFDQV